MTPASLRPVPAVRPRAVLYLRQSVAREDSVSIELQRVAGEDYCARMGYDVIAVEVDEGFSGRKWSTRPGVQRVLDMVERRDADVIVLWRWSRLSRSRKDWALAADRVDVAGGRIESATEPIDTATASGRFARGVMTEYSAFQSEQIGEQWNEVHARRFSLGLPPTGKLPWGWESKRDHIVISDENAEIIRQMYQLYFEGRGATYIAGWMNRQGLRAPRGGDWLAITVKSCLDSPIHAGMVTYRGETKDGAHEGVITQDEYARYQALRGERYVPKRPRKSKFLLSSLVVCHCGRKRYGSTSRSKWGDRTKTYESYVCPTTTSHERVSIISWRVDNAVIEWARTLDIHADPTVAPAKADTEHIARELLAVDRRLDALTEHLVSGLVPAESYARTRDMLLTQGAELKAALGEAETSTVMTPAAFLGEDVTLLEQLQSLPFDEKQATLRALIDSVTIRADGKLEIRPLWSTKPVIVDTM